MIVRITYVKFAPDSTDEARRIYNEEVIPVARVQKGNIGIRMLEPVDKSEDFISISEWATQADADLYESSGTYKALVGKLLSFTTKEPVLKTYIAEDVLALH